MHRPSTSRPRLVALLGGAVGLGALAASGPLLAADEGPHDKAIQARQAMFQLYSWNIGPLSDMAKEKIPYDAERAAAAAANLDMLANLSHDGFWPEGSDSESEGNATNRALPAIWEDYPDITSKVDALRTATAELKTAAGSGLGELQGAIGDVGGACKGCHDDYRAEKE